MLNACASYLQEEPVSSRDIENAAREQAALLARKIKNAPDLRCPHRILIASMTVRLRRSKLEEEDPDEDDSHPSTLAVAKAGRKSSRAGELTSALTGILGKSDPEVYLYLFSDLFLVLVKRRSGWLCQHAVALDAVQVIDSSLAVNVFGLKFPESQVFCLWPKKKESFAVP
eukprot:m.241488 g.241488  ORF g.241488 m.241488 type:complete len:171 (-) comp10939_c1_seq37:1185-1697(-)